MAYPLEALLRPAYELRAAGVVFAPLVHRFLHKLHADELDLAEPQAHSKKSKVYYWRPLSGKNV